jgi:two-component system, chemotaxis family, protein-glutamate methylesterase/glutaminase
MTDVEGSASTRPHASGRVTQRDIVVVGASAGGVEALGTLIAGLPAELPAALFVCLHVSPGGTSVLPHILSRKTAMPVAAARDGEPIQRGRVYVAPPDHHMLIEDGHVSLTHGPRENGLRPAIDPLFRSAARAYGRRVVGVVLSGSLDDGTAGLKVITDSGGAGLVQDPADALYPSMPRHALEYDAPRAVPIADMAKAVCAMIDEPLPDNGEDPPMPPDPDRPEEAELADPGDPKAGDLTGLTCPECGGALWEHNESGLVRFKCHVGHAYSPDSLDVSQSQALEMALWAAVRSLQERGDLYRRLARRTRGGERFDQKAADADEHAAVLRRLITSFGREPDETAEAGEVG